MKYAPDIAAGVGLILLASGIAAYDWRMALVVLGAILAGLGIYGARNE